MRAAQPFEQRRGLEAIEVLATLDEDAQHLGGVGREAWRGRRGAVGVGR